MFTFEFANNHLGNQLYVDAYPGEILGGIRKRLSAFQIGLEAAAAALPTEAPR